VSYLPDGGGKVHSAPLRWGHHNSTFGGMPREKEL
jgi:hypothetical protein